MRIGINLLFLKPGIAGGTETYSYGLLKGLMDIASAKDEFFVFCNLNVNPDFLQRDKRFTIIKYNVGKSVAARCLYEQLIFPFQLKKYKLDVLHSLGYLGPVVTKNHIVTIHDANAFVHSDMGWFKKFFLSFLLKQTAKACTHIIAVSQFSKQEILKHIKVLPEKITVIYEAGKFGKNAKNQSLSGELEFLNSKCFFLALSSASKMKNIITLIDAFKILSEKNPQLLLVLAGHLPPDSSIENQINVYHLTDKIFVTGYIKDEEMIVLFKKSVAFIFPSLYEGFGLPLLEAQSLGTPVISSNKGSLPEIGKDTVFYFDPTNTMELSEKMKLVYADNMFREDLIKKGFSNVQRFSWNETAKQTLDLYTHYGKA